MSTARLQPTLAGHRRRKLLRVVVAAATFLGLLVLSAVAGLYWSAPLLTVEHKPAQADVIVVLGGEPAYRPPRALEIYEQRFASKIIVSGEGDTDEIQRWLMAKRVPTAAILTDSKSVNTWQNAEFTIALLRAKNARRVIIVTSWFHSRRALACFRKAAPEMEFISLPTVVDRPNPHWPSQYERVSVLREYFKLIGYWLRYGVSPF